MKLRWHPEAKRAMLQVGRYIRKEFGLKHALRFKQEVDETAKKLMRSPNIGQIDPLFNDMPVTFRSIIINGLNKMVYYVEDDTINIAAFWDTRMDEKAQASKIK